MAGGWVRTTFPNLQRGAACVAAWQRRIRQQYVWVRVALWIAVGIPPINDALHAREEMRTHLDEMQRTIAAGLTEQVYCLELHRQSRPLELDILRRFDTNHDGSLSSAEAFHLRSAHGVSVVVARTGLSLEDPSSPARAALERLRLDLGVPRGRAAYPFLAVMPLRRSQWKTTAEEIAAWEDAQRAADETLRPLRSETDALFAFHLRDVADVSAWSAAMRAYGASLRRMVTLDWQPATDPFGTRSALLRRRRTFDPQPAPRIAPLPRLDPFSGTDFMYQDACCFSAGVAN